MGNITISFEERAITNFASQADIQNDIDHRGKWIGIGDDLINQTTLMQQPQDISKTALAFEPQRIRSFVITYKKAVTPEELKANEVANAKEKEDENKIVNLGKNEHTNLDRINRKISNEKVKPEQSPESQSFISTKLDQFQSMPSSEFELVRI